MKHARTDPDYAVLNKWVKPRHEEKLVSNLLTMLSVGFEQTFIKFIEISIPQDKFLYRKKKT